MVRAFTYIDGIGGRAVFYFTALDAKAFRWLRRQFPLNEPAWGCALHIPPRLVQAVEERFVYDGGELLDFTDNAN